MKHKSLKSRPGAGKKREKLLAAERERFARNLGLMAGAEADVQVARDEGNKGHDGEGGGSRQRWAAIRRHIEENVERRDPDAG